MKRLIQISSQKLLLVLFALMLMPIGVWADSYFAINYTVDNSLKQTWVSDEDNNLEDILGDGTMSYDATNNILTFNGIDLELSPDDTRWDFISCQDTDDHPSLTIRLVGTNNVTLGDNNPGFFYGKDLTFITDTEDPGSLTINIQSGWAGNLFENSFSGDPTINPTYNNHLYLDDGYDDHYTIQTLLCTVPFTYMDDGIMWFRMGYETGCDDEVLYYSIDYVDENLEDVTDEVFNIEGDDLPIYGPCTMTYYSTAGGGQSEVGTAYYLGLSTNAIKTTLGTSVAPPTVVPALSENLELIISETTSPASGVTPVYDSTTGLISTSAIGETTCSVKIYCSEANANNINVLNNTDGTEKYELGDFTLTVREPGLFVAGVKVTTDNASEITGKNIEGTVSYDAEKNKLTLSDATITGQIICSYDALTVHLIGYNTITPGDGQSPFVYSNPGTGTLTFTTNENPNRSRLEADGVTSIAALGLGYAVSNTFETRTTQQGSEIGAGVEAEDGWKVVIFENDYNSPDHTIIWNFKNYNLFIGGCRVTSDNLMGNGYISYDPDRHTFPIYGETHYALKSGLEELIIEVSGEATIDVSDYSDPAIPAISFEAVTGGPTSGTLKFVKAADADLASITLTPSDTHKAIEGFAVDDIIITEPLQLKTPASKSDILDATSVTIANFNEVYDISIAGTSVTDGNAEDVFGDGTVSYDAENNILTLNGATIIPEQETPGIVYYGEADLTINLKGTNNTVKGSDGCTAIAYYNYTQLETAPSLTFAKGDEQACSVLLEALGETVIDGFAEEINHNGLYMLKDSREEDETLISTITVTSTFLSGGSGTAQDPFLLKTKEDVRDFAKYINNMSISAGASFLLNNDIDCDGLTGYEAAGLYDNPFLGVFDGNKKTISSLTAQDGLFGYVDGATIMDLTFSGCSITGATGSSAAGIVAEALNATTIQNCSVVNSTIACKEDAYNPTVGGIVASLYGGTVTECTVDNVQVKAETTYNYGSIPQGKVGGIVGNASGGEISSCEVKNGSKITDYYADENAQLYAGAIVGDYYGTTLSANYYHYDVNVETLNGTNNENKVTKSGYTQRAVGGTTYNEQTEEEEDNPDIFEDNGAVMYTKKVTLPEETDAASVIVEEETYYSTVIESDVLSILVAPGQTATINATPGANYFIVSLTATNATTSAAISTTPTEMGDNITQYTFEMPDAPVTVTLTTGEAITVDFGSRTWATFCSEYDMAVPDGAKAYAVSSIVETTVNVSEIGYIPAGKGVLLELQKEASSTVTISSLYTGSLTVTTTGLLGTTAETAVSGISGKVYVLYNDNFVRATSGSIPANRGYLTISNEVVPVGARLAIKINDVVAGVHSIYNEPGTMNHEVYNLNGQIVTNPSKGLYIVNGKIVNRR